VRDFFGIDDDYTRHAPAPPWWPDVAVPAVLMVLSLTGLLGMATLEGFSGEADLQVTVPLTLLAGALFVLRRRFPVLVLLLVTGAHFLVVGILWPIVVVQPGMQVLYFLGLYSAMAWARHREALMLAVVAVLLAMSAWLAWGFATDMAAYRLVSDAAPTMLIVSQVLVNVAYFGGAIWLGRNAWLRARSDDALAASRAVVEEQGAQLAEQAIVAERLRIARELHDSVAHHVSLIGVQAAAARRAMEKKPEAAARALQGVEQTARQSVQELRSVLGSLRDARDTGTPGTPGLSALPSLLAETRTLGLDVALETVGGEDALDRLSVTQSATLYRVVQEALTNVRRHSTATRARVTIRVDGPMAEAEVVDDGRPRPGTRGTGLGQMGIVERVAALGGTSEIGPRPERGYRVLARLPPRPETVA